MPSPHIRLEIVSAEAAIFSGDVAMIVVSGVNGELGIAPGHTQLLTPLKPGHIEATMVNGSKQETFYISGGMLEVQPDIATVLADTALRAADLDEAAALAAKEDAERKLSGHKSQGELDKATKELAEAVAQLRIIQSLRKHQG